MTTLEPITLNLPSSLYDRLKRRADNAHRTVEAELLEVVATAVPEEDQLSTELEAALAPLALLDDEALWRAARTRLSDEASDQLEALHFKRQRDGLTELEAQVVRSLVEQYERTMVVRATAAALLRQRGHEVTELLAETPPKP
jgi:plasmid stability protein